MHFWKSIITLLLYSVFNTNVIFIFYGITSETALANFWKKQMSRTGKRIEINENIIMTLMQIIIDILHIQLTAKAIL